LDGPFIVLLKQDGTDQADDGILIGKDAGNSVRRLISPVGLVECGLARYSLGEVV
jgi:hypothetical protein